MSPLWPVAVITFKEGIRNKAVYGISVFALIMMVANLLISGMIMREVGKVSVDIALSSISFLGLLLVLFVGINLLAKDLDKRTIYMVLARPISRGEYIVGKFLGMVLLIVVSISILSLFAVASIFLVKMSYPDYFQRFSWPMIFLSISFTTLSLILLSALSFLFASFASTSFISLILTIAAYIIGHSMTDVKALVEAPQSVGIQVSPLTVKVVQIAYYIFPNLSIFDIKTQAAHDLAIPMSYIFLAVSYGLVYTCIAIILASLIFRKREFP
jgi:ABC-type transport system involved in multi-copper enzyme maturation permease subunit